MTFLRRMYAVAIDNEIVAGTVSYSRSAALKAFFGGSSSKEDWKEMKANGYRTVAVAIRIEQ